MEGPQAAERAAERRVLDDKTALDFAVTTLARSHLDKEPRRFASDEVLARIRRSLEDALTEWLDELACSGDASLTLGEFP